MFLTFTPAAAFRAISVFIASVVTLVSGAEGQSLGSGADEQWPSYRHDLFNSGFAKSSYDPRTVKLRQRWTYAADSYVTSTPTQADGLVYAGTWNGDVLALDAATGAQRWRAHLGANPDEVYGGPRGVIGAISIDNGVVFAASGNCTIAAFDARRGKQRWRRTICDIARNDDLYASPVVAGGLVLIGVSMLDDRPTDRGREIALDAATGAVRWEIEPARYRGTGTGITASPAVDVLARRVYLGTGNPTPANSPPAGDDPGSDSILALDLTTGKTIWSYGPVHPHDVNDDDFMASPNLFNAGSDAQPKWAIGEGNKDGAYYAVGIDTGMFLWRRVLAPVSQSAMIVGTAAVGNGAVYVPLYNGTVGSLSALRTTDGAVMWQQPTGGEYEAPVLWGSVVFTTEASGWLDAFGAGTGKPLGRWHLCGRAMGRGPSVARGGLYVAAGKCLTYFAATRS